MTFKFLRQECSSDFPSQTPVRRNGRCACDVRLPSRLPPNPRGSHLHLHPGPEARLGDVQLPGECFSEKEQRVSRRWTLKREPGGRPVGRESSGSAGSISRDPRVSAGPPSAHGPRQARLPPLRSGWGWVLSGAFKSLYSYRQSTYGSCNKV